MSLSDFGSNAALVALFCALSWTLAPCVPASAAPAGVDSTESVSAMILEHARHLHDYTEAMHNADPSIRTAALAMALKDSDRSVHALALSGYLKRFDALTPEVAVDPGSVIAPQDIPRLAMADLRWSDNGLSFRGNYSTTCSGGVPVRGQIAGDVVSIVYDGVCLRPAVAGIDTEGSAVKAAQARLYPCEVALKPNAEATALEGKLRCIGVPTVLPVRLPFGD